MAGEDQGHAWPARAVAERSKGGRTGAGMSERQAEADAGRAAGGAGAAVGVGQRGWRSGGRSRSRGTRVRVAASAGASSGQHRAAVEAKGGRRRADAARQRKKIREKNIERMIIEPHN